MLIIAVAVAVVVTLVMLVAVTAGNKDSAWTVTGSIAIAVIL
jgi:hypothetical protein